jgi:hypothetical protein
MRRKIEQQMHRYTVVESFDEPGEGGAYHEYYISNAKDIDSDNVVAGEYGHVKFQKGPVAENGVNGCFMEDLLAIVKDRLECFQSGDFACVENEMALNDVNQALAHLNMRTKDRYDRGVEGKSIK